MYKMMFVVPAMQMEKEDSLTTSTAKSQPVSSTKTSDIPNTLGTSWFYLFSPVYCLDKDHTLVDARIIIFRLG